MTEKPQIESDPALLHELNESLRIILEEEKSEVCMTMDSLDSEYTKLRLASKAAVLNRIKNFCTTIRMEVTT